MDREVYLQSLPSGHWDFFAVWQDGKLSLAQQLEFLDLHLYFDTDGGAALTTPENGTFQGEETRQQVFINCDEHQEVQVSVPDPENKDQLIYFHMIKRFYNKCWGQAMSLTPFS